MEIRWAHLCSREEWHGPGATLTNISPGYRAKADGRAPFPSEFAVALRPYASTGDGPVNHMLRVSVTDSKDQPQSAPFEAPVRFTYLGEGLPLFGGVGIRLGGWELPGPGAYSVDCSIDGNLYARIPLTVFPANGPDIPPKIRDPLPVRLAWAHFVLGYNRPGGGKPLVLRDIMEFLLTPPGAHTLDLAGSFLVAQIEADLDSKPSRQLRVELLDGNGQSMMQPHIHDTILRPGLGGMLVSTIPVPLTGIRLPIESYQFRFYLDDRPLGQPLDITVLPPARPSRSSVRPS